MKSKFASLHLDFVGFTISIICAIHCAALPFLLSLAPLTGLRFLNNPWVEYIIIFISFIIAAQSIMHGYKKHHRKPLALLIVAAGFILIGSGHTQEAEWQEITFTALGATTVAIAHFINWRYIQRARSPLPQCFKNNQGEKSI